MMEVLRGVDAVLVRLFPLLAEPQASLTASLLTACSEADALLLLELPACPSGILALLAQHPRAKVRRQVARHPFTSPNVRTLLLLDKSVTVRRAAAAPDSFADPGTLTPTAAAAMVLGDKTGDTLRRVLKDPYWMHVPEVMAAVIDMDPSAAWPASQDFQYSAEPAEIAAFIRTPEGLSMLLQTQAGGYENYQQFMRVVEEYHHDVSRVLALCARPVHRESSWEVRQMAAASLHTSVTSLGLLALDSDMDVAAAALLNPNLPLEDLLKATHATHLYSRDVIRQVPAFKDPQVVSRAVKVGAGPVLLAVLTGRLKSGMTRDAVVHAAVFSDEIQVREYAAGIIDLPEHLALRLAQDDSFDVRDALLHRDDLSREIVLAASVFRVPWEHLGLLSDDDILLLPWEQVRLEIIYPWGPLIPGERPRLCEVVACAFSQNVRTSAHLEVFRSLSDEFEGSVREFLDLITRV